MPDAFEFDRAAAMFDAAAARSDSLLVGTRNLVGPETMRDGRLPLLADLTVDTAARSTRLVADELREQAAICRARAEICRAYADRLSAFTRDLERWDRELAGAANTGSSGRLRARPQRPARPGTWVEL